MYGNRSALVFDDVVILLLILVFSVMMNGCGFSDGSYQGFSPPFASQWRLY